MLEASGRTVYGFGSDFDSREARFLRSEDGGRSWTRLSPPEPLLSLAIDPADRRHIVALGEERGYVSRDGGSRWRPLSVPGGLVTWTQDLGLVAIDLEGTVRRAEQPSATWAEVGDLDGPPPPSKASKASKASTASTTNCSPPATTRLCCPPQMAAGPGGRSSSAERDIRDHFEP